MFEHLSFSALEMPTELFGVAALALSGAMLVERALRLKRDEIAARVGLIEPWTHAVSVNAARKSQALEMPLRSTNLSASQREIARRLRKLGIHARFAPASLLAIRALAALGFVIGCWFLMPHLLAFSSLLFRVVFAASMGVFGWFLPVLATRWIAGRRAARVVAGLPDALELLVICAEGGLALGDGIDRIVLELKRSQPELAEELELTAADLKILPSQDQALLGLAERIDVPIVRSVVTTLAQTMRFGTPFAQAMRVVAAEMRNEALIRLEERANKLPALLTVPMMLLIMPTIFLIVGGPAALKIIDLFLRR